MIKEKWELGATVLLSHKHTCTCARAHTVYIQSLKRKNVLASTKRENRPLFTQSTEEDPVAGLLTYLPPQPSPVSGHAGVYFRPVEPLPFAPSSSV